jgi:hypothetical protein
VFKRIILLSLVLVACSGFLNVFGLGWKSRVPDELRRGISIEYKLDRTHFFGPGGINEAFIVYNISDDVAREMQDKGLLYLDNMPSTQKYNELYTSYENLLATGNLTSEQERKNRFAYWRSTRGLYRDWQATPIPDSEERWNRNRNKYYKRWIREGVPVEERWARYSGKYRWHDTACKDISMCSFYGGYKSIPPIFESSDVLRNKTLEELNFTDEIESEYIELVENIIKSPNNYFGYGEFGVFVVSPRYKKAFLLYRD